MTLPADVPGSSGAVIDLSGPSVDEREPVRGPDGPAAGKCASGL